MRLVRHHIAILLRLTLMLTIAFGSTSMRTTACPFAKPVKVESTSSCCVKKRTAKEHADHERKNCCGRKDDRCCCPMTLLLFIGGDPASQVEDRISLPTTSFIESATTLPHDPPFHPPRG